MQYGSTFRLLARSLEQSLTNTVLLTSYFDKKEDILIE